MIFPKYVNILTQRKSFRIALDIENHLGLLYAHKMIDYEALTIPEYWIVDYLGLGGSRYIGYPKQPTLSVYQLVDGEYQITLFRGDERIESAVFPELNLTAKQIFNGG